MEEKNNGIDLLVLLTRFTVALRKVWILLLIVPVLSGLFFYNRSKNSFVPMYEAKAYFTVESGYQAEDILSTQTSVRIVAA